MGNQHRYICLANSNNGKYNDRKLRRRRRNRHQVEMAEIISHCGTKTKTATINNKITMSYVPNRRW
jgi:hypothetical protein